MPKNRFCLPFVQVLINQSCNMSCLGCCTISDQPWSSYVSWDQGRAWLTDWGKRIEFQRFGIVGGEPFINPQLDQWIRGVRDLFPESRIQITTNGSLLHRRMDIVDIMQEVGNSTLKISRHLPDLNCDRALDQIRQRFNWRTIQEYGLTRYVTDSEFRLDIRDLPAGRPYMEKNLFIKTYNGEHHDMKPYDNDPVESYAACVENGLSVLTLHQAKLYKCMTMALRREELDKFGRPHWESWQPYLDQHPGLDHSASDQDLARLFENIGKPAVFCRQCPTQDQESTFFDHSVTVSWKKPKGINNESQTHQ